MRTASPKPELPEIYMRLTDRDRLARLMKLQQVSQRQVAAAAGWASHSYLGRLLAGAVSTLEPEPALRIQLFLKPALEAEACLVPNPGPLFVANLSSSTVRTGQPHRKAA